ncbi:MAG TPA: YceH family protein [Acidimicrobiales bacterium]|nr:YceH family protein [Acidimicrobiales bacterium]
MELTAEEQRVLGCLLEKAATTPENYPLTLNALVNACNQTSNRDPVVTYREDTVNAALTSLREQKLIRIVYPAHARATKFRHVLDEAWALSGPELAVIAVLLLRGAQTEAELVTRTERYGDLSDFGGVPGVLDRLARRPEPLVQLVERRAGQREDRYVHLLGPSEVSDHPDPPAGRSSSTAERILALEVETATLRNELTRLREWLEDLLGGPESPPKSAND